MYRRPWVIVLMAFALVAAVAGVAVAVSGGKKAPAASTAALVPATTPPAEDAPPSSSPAAPNLTRAPTTPTPDQSIANALPLVIAGGPGVIPAGPTGAYLVRVSSVRGSRDAKLLAGEEFCSTVETSSIAKAVSGLAISRYTAPEVSLVALAAGANLCPDYFAAIQNYLDSSPAAVATP